MGDHEYDDGNGMMIRQAADMDPIKATLMTDAIAERLGRFDHHPDPAIDFEIEVQSLQARLFDAKAGVSKPGTEPEQLMVVLNDIWRAMTFTVGGDPGAVAAKALLRELEAEAKEAARSSTDAIAVKHTPGPWKVSPGHADGSVTVRQDGGEFQRPVAEIWHNGDDHTANARLIAAAPDLLASLRDIAKQWPDSSAGKTARAAIAKAEGRS